MSIDAFARRWSARTTAIPLHALRFADSIGALLTGSRTREGRALAEVYGRRTAPAYMAAVIRLTELDDIDLRTCTTPSAVVVPVVLDAAYRAGATPAEVARGLHAGYVSVARAALAAGGIEALARGVWPTLLVAPLGAAAASAAVRALPAERMAAAMRLGLARAVGRAGATIPPLPSRWWLFGESVAAGIACAGVAAAGFSADAHLDAQLAGDGFGDAAGDDDCGWVSQKTFPTARQGANALVAFRDLLRDEELDPAQIVRVEVEVPPACARLIAQPLDPANRLMLIANAGFQFGAAAYAPELLAEVDRQGPFPAAVLAFAERVAVAPSTALEADFPRRWGARVVVELAGGRRVERTRHTIAGDPEEPLTPAALAAKYPNLARATLDDAAAALSDAEALARTLERIA
jgi:2-methylcitrate dehydratase PrpD